jgi:Flp pilus assembly protein TadG
MRVFLRRFIRETKANVAAITALAAIPMFFLTGMGIDYSMAVDRKTLLDGYADAAALAAVTPNMIAQGAAAEITAARNTFNAQAQALSDISYNAANLTVTLATAGSTQTATVSYVANYQTMFSHILGTNTIALQGSSSATAGLAPNIDFYLLLDDSPSMAIAATQAGINTMVAHTASQGGCAFGCHETHPSSDNLGNPNGEDNYTLARNLGVTLRMDLLRQAAQDLMVTAQTTETTNSATYRMAIYTFDAAFNTIQSLTSNLATAQMSAGNINLLTVYANNWLTSNNNNSDTDTNYDNAMTRANSIMPNPGSGTNTAGDTPQEVLFFVTDGVEDEKVGGNRQQSLMNPTWCTTIKNRGIRIAVLYTAYLPLPTNAWYNTWISPFQPNIASTMQSCASPGLFFQVNTGGDISAAMTALFQLAIHTAYLSR